MQDFEALQKRYGMLKILESDEDIKTMEPALQRINNQLQNFELAMIASIERMAESTHEQMVLQSLYRITAKDASHDAGERFPPPQCHPQTRTEILQQLAEWMDGPNSQILWLHGPAGAGKSAIAQSFFQDAVARGQLVASFFFKRGDPSRGESMKLFPTIAHQFARLIPKFRSAIVYRMDEDPSVFDKALSTQLETLIMKPIRHVPQTGNSVVVIDGLDECAGERRQQEIVRAIAQSLLESRPPLRFLIASRPEAHITELFQEATLQNIHCQVNIDPSFTDIHTYFRDEFARICSDHKMMAGIPAPWPSQQVLELLIQKSSGYFIYAATVIKSIDDPDFRPTDRLETILGMAEPEDESPFATLDQLYIQILESVPARSQLLRVLSVFAAQLMLSIFHIEQLLGFKAGDVWLTLRRVHSVIKVPSQVTELDVVTTHHASFLYFLNDKSRSRAFHIGVGSVHHHKLVIDMFKAFACRTDDPTRNDIIGLVAWQIDIRLVTLALPSTDLLDHLRRVNAEFLFFLDVARQDWVVKRSEAVLEWLRKFEPSPPPNVISLWMEYRFMASCDSIWSPTSSIPTDCHAEEFHEMEYLLTQTPPDLIRILHAYRLLYDSDMGYSTPVLWEIRSVFNYSWDEMRNLLLPIQSIVGDQEDTPYKLKLLFWSICHPTRIHQLHPDQSLVQMAQDCLRTMIRLTTHELPNVAYATAPFWGCVLRACPPDPELLLTVREAEQLSALSDPTRPWNMINVYNTIEWLKTFPNPSGDLIARVQELLPNSTSVHKDFEGQDLEEVWEGWKARTGW